MKKEEKEIKNKILYECENEMTAEEFGIMCTYFSNYYWNFVPFGTLVAIICSVLLCLMGEGDFETGVVFFVMLEIITLIVYKIRLRKMCEKQFNKELQKNPIDTHYTIQFYEKYIIRKINNLSKKIEYKQITKVVETNTHFYLKIAKGVIVIPKDKCESDLLEFIRSKFNTILEIKIKKINYKKQNKQKQEIKQCTSPIVRKLLIILFALTIASLWGALGTMPLLPIENSNFGFIKNTWVFWLWLPIPVLSIVLGFKYKKQGVKCKKNIIGGFIIGILLLIYGSFSLIFRDLNDFTNSIFVITEDEHTEQIEYYEVNYSGNKREVDKFKSEVDIIYNTSGCYTWDSDEKYINQITWDTCEILDENQNRIEINEDFKNILVDVQKNEESAIFEIKIFKIENNYYVVVPVNVNMWTPYDFYYYNLKEEKLEFIDTFSCKDIIGIKLK